MDPFPKILFVFFIIFAVSSSHKVVNVGLNCQILNDFIAAAKQQCIKDAYTLRVEKIDGVDIHIYKLVIKSIETIVVVMERRLNILNGQIDKMITTCNAATIHGPFRTHRRDSDVRYRRKLFKLSESLHLREDVNLTSAKQMCRNIGWKLANIYSIEHYQFIVSYLRNKILGSNFASVWLAMTWDQQNVHLSNGTIAPTLPWYPDFPEPDESRDKLSIVVRSNLKNRNQGMVNFPPSYYRTGALCEL